MTTGERIKQRREKLGISQKELANRTGYTSRSAITKIENGSLELTRSRLIEFANALYTTPMYLLGFEDESNCDIKLISAISKYFPNVSFTETEIEEIIRYIDYVVSRDKKRPT